MPTKKRKLQNTKRYSDCFKRARVREFEDGEYSVSQISRLYHVSCQTIYNWIAKYSSMSNKNAVIVEVPNSQSAKLKALEKRLAEQEALIGRMTVQLDLKQRMLDIYEQDAPAFKKKAASTMRSTGSSQPTTKTPKA